MDDFSAETLLMRMLEDVSFYLLLITMVLLFVRRNFWISLSAVGMFLYFTPFFNGDPVCTFGVQGRVCSAP